MPQSNEMVAGTATATRINAKSYAAMAVAENLVPWDFTRRSPRPHDVLVEILYCGVCHTDIHFIRNDFGMSAYPLVPGHEIVGKVKEVGSDVKKFKAG